MEGFYTKESGILKLSERKKMKVYCRKVGVEVIMVSLAEL